MSQPQTQSLGPVFKFNGRSFSSLRDFAPGELDFPATKMELITPAVGPFSDGIARAIWSASAVLVDLIQVDGTPLINFPLQPGWNRIMCAGMTAVHSSVAVFRIY